MKLFGFLGKEKPVPFPQFRDAVRLAVRRADPSAKMEYTDNGFKLTLEGSPKPMTCNLRSLYASYCKTPSDRDTLIAQWLDTVLSITNVPEHRWSEANSLLRPSLMDAETLAAAQYELKKEQVPDSLPAQPFVGELSVIVVRDLPGIAAPVTQKNLDAWGASFEQTMQQALNNMNMLSFPKVTNELLAGGTARKGAPDGEVVGQVFDGDHLTATWLALERFRDHLSMVLQGDYIVSVPNRSRLIAVRSDELSLITSIQHANRNFRTQPYALTAQCYHVSASTTGGVVTVYQPGGTMGEKLDENSLFAGGKTAAPLPNFADSPVPTPTSRPQPVDFSTWGLKKQDEDADDKPSDFTPWNRGKS